MRFFLEGYVDNHRCSRALISAVVSIVPSQRFIKMNVELIQNPHGNVIDHVVKILRMDSLTIVETATM